jgi:hypothetical protein
MERNSQRRLVPVFDPWGVVRRCTALAILGAFVSGTMESAQSVDATSSFEVAAVRPNAGTGLFTLAVQPGGRFVATRVRLEPRNVRAAPRLRGLEEGPERPAETVE